MIGFGKNLLLLVALAGLSTAFADVCEVRLSPYKTKEIFYAQSAQPWRLDGLKGTPLEVSAFLRKWKTELARKLDFSPDFVNGRFQKGSTGFEEISRPEQVRLLLVRTVNGVKAIVLIKVDLKAQLLTYVDPSYAVREQRSSIFAIADDGKPSLHISAFEDSMDRHSVTGNLVGVLTLKVPGLHLNLN